MKVNMRPVGDFRGEGKVYRVRSASSYTTWHFVVVFEKHCPECLGNKCTMCLITSDEHDIVVCNTCEGTGKVVTVECSCTGFQVHHKCWHMEKVHEWDSLPNMPQDIQVESGSDDDSA